MDERKLLQDAIDELAELLQTLDVAELQSVALIPLMRTAYQMCGGIIAAKKFLE